jgi:RNA polymerase sigma factor (sigma-70 family)
MNTPGQGKEKDRDCRSWWERSAVALGAFGGPERKKTMPYAQHIQQSTLREQGVLDGALVELALAGDHSAFDVLVNRYRTILARYIGGFFRDSEQVFDVLQHVFLQLYLSLPVLLTNVSLHTWLFQVARNRCLDELRRRRRRAEVPFSTFEREVGEELSPVEVISDPEPLPEEVTERCDLRCFRQLSFSEVGRMLDMPEARVKASFYHSLPRLRRTLAGSKHVAAVS